MWKAFLTIARQERAQVTACILLAGWMSLLSGTLLSWVTLKLAAIALTVSLRISSGAMLCPECHQTVGVEDDGHGHGQLIAHDINGLPWRD